jgi:AcrR family transcriptional regulator
MAEVVEGRPLGGRRRVKSRATRRRITDAAAELFVQHSYATTTLEHIAHRAGVSVQTVYFHFGTKANLLKAAVDIASVGDDEPVALLDRPEFRRIRGEPDPRKTLRLEVRQAREIFARIGPLMRVVRDAAGSDPDMATQWLTNEQQRLMVFGEVARELSAKGGLRPGMTVEEATDVIFGLLSVELHELLTTGRGWSNEHWERWINEMLSQAILEP